jgi:hypothetical protein
MTIYEVYRQVALDSIQCYRNLEVLSYAWQTAHLDASYPSWIPRWDININDWTPRALLPFLYDAARGTFPILQPSFEVNTLTIQGLNLGSIVETNTLLKIEAGQVPTNYSDGESSTNDYLMSMSRIMVQDRWQDPIDLENTAERAYKNLGAHFADFSAYLLPLLEKHKMDSYISVSSSWCDVCGKDITTQREPMSNLPKAYHCHSCDGGDFLLCSECYDKGIRCEDPGHVLQSTIEPGLWCPYTCEIINRLEAHAKMGNGDRFFDTARSACAKREFLRTSQGWRGVGPQTVEPGDTLVIFFGSRVPFILRKHDTFYRLISDCYINGLMDGEAINMWEDGELKVEEFDIR